MRNKARIAVYPVIIISEIFNSLRVSNKSMVFTSNFAADLIENV
jgi:hypothetical protein